MDLMGELIVGVLGGMGPESTAELLVQITRCTPAVTEQDHLRVIIDSNPKIPNRTDALLSGETGPVIEALAQTALNLERAGAEIIGIPCNTAHAFLADVRAAVSVPVIDMIGETALRAVEIFGEKVTVGLLATDGTLRTRLYHEALEEAYSALAVAVRNLASDGATALIAGCTEVSLVLRRHPPDLPWLDPLQILAEALVREAMGERIGAPG